MTPTWKSSDEPAPVAIPPLGWVRIIWRGGLLGGVTFGGLIVLVLLRLIERPIWNQHRPWTPFITQFVCKMALFIIGLRLTARGSLMRAPGGVVANHASWLDIFVLNARKRIYFVSKSEVANWPAIGWLARATGTVFITRNGRDAGVQRDLFAKRLSLGHKLLFFPEGTSTDGLHIVPFKSTLFEAFFTSNLRPDLAIQPVSIVYLAPDGEDARFYGWWGEMLFGTHLLKVLAARRQGSVQVIYHAPLAVADFADRKELARACEAAVRSGFPNG